MGQSPRSELWTSQVSRLQRVATLPGLATALAVLMALVMLAPQHTASAFSIGNCTYWVAPPPVGNNAQPGTAAQPWATLEYASNNVPDNSCTVWLADGVYSGEQSVDRRFTTPTTFRATNPYHAILENNGPAVSMSGSMNVTLDGFIFQHSGASATPLLFVIDQSDDGWAEQITLRNNIFRDSYNNDLLKLIGGLRFVTIENNIFYNQGPNEEHIDVNSVTDVVIQDNIFFNDYAGSGRADPGDTKAFITIKDSNEGADGQLGSERVAIRRNIFLNWQGDVEPFLQIGNDGKPYHEAKEVWIENNLMVGNSDDDVNAVLAISGARDVHFTNNTVAGNMPARAYALRVERKGQNPLNENLFLYNNIWSDPTGTMGAGPSSGTNEFADGEPVEVTNLVLDNNLYWNGGAAIPPGDILSPLVDDANRVVANPMLNEDQSNITLPRWQGAAFLSGNTTNRQEFERLVSFLGIVPNESPAVDAANAAFAPSDDILGRPRAGSADLGAYEATIPTATTLTGARAFTPAAPGRVLYYSLLVAATAVALWVRRLATSAATRAAVQSVSLE